MPAFISRLLEMNISVEKQNSTSSTDNILVEKGHHLHELLLYLVLFFSSIYTVVNFITASISETLVTAFPLLITCLCFYLLRKKHYRLSKAINLIQVIVVIGILCTYTSPATGILAFYVPIFIGILITFQGKELRFGYWLTVIAFLLLLFLLSVQHYREFDIGQGGKELKLEWLLNYLGASLATIFEMLFILRLSDKIQQSLVEKSENLKHKNEQLEKVNNKFNLITSQSGIGIWEFDMISRKAEWNSVLAMQYGLDKEDLERDFYGVWVGALHPEDRDRVVERADAFEKSDWAYWQEEYRIIHNKSKEIRYLKCLTVGERDSSGNMKRLIGSILDVTLEKNLQSSLEENNAQLKKANAELDNFVYSVSHDLRSPLLSVKGLISLIFQHSAIDSETSTYLAMADKSINRLDETIGEILEYSRNARLEIHRESFSLKTLLDHICDDLHFSAEDNFQFKTTILGPDEIIFDRYRLTALLRNLIGNSVKYRRKNIDNPYVKCEMMHQEKKLIFVISDNGEGISETDMPKIFDMFYRGNTNTVGTGLGLYICREVINKLGGEMGIESVLGSGTTITVTIPL